MVCSVDICSTMVSSGGWRGISAAVPGAHPPPPPPLTSPRPIGPWGSAMPCSGNQQGQPRLLLAEAALKPSRCQRLGRDTQYSVSRRHGRSGREDESQGWEKHNKTVRCQYQTCGWEGAGYRWQTSYSEEASHTVKQDNFYSNICHHWHSVLL